MARVRVGTDFFSRISSLTSRVEAGAEEVCETFHSMQLDFDYLTMVWNKFDEIIELFNEIISLEV